MKVLIWSFMSSKRQPSISNPQSCKRLDKISPSMSLRTVDGLIKARNTYGLNLSVALASAKLAMGLTLLPILLMKLVCLLVP